MRCMSCSRTRRLDGAAWARCLVIDSSDAPERRLNVPRLRCRDGDLAWGCVKLVAPCFIAIAFGESFASRATAYSFGQTAAIKPRQHRFRRCEARGKPSKLLQAPRSPGASKPNLPSRNTNHDLNCGGRGGL